MRRFGIELELVAPIGQDPSRFSIATLGAVSVPCRSNTHFGNDYSVWQAKPDSSLSPAGRCIEVVSRIMPADESAYVEVRRAVRALQAAGFGINRTCGFHVHVDCSDLSNAQRLMVAIRYSQMQDAINTILPPSRRSNGFCVPPSTHEIAGMVSSIVSRTADRYSPPDRYRPVNLAHARTRGTLEFRQAAGTCDPEKVVGWVTLLQEMIETVKARTTGITFGTAAPAPRPAPTVRPVAAAPTRRPRLREGSHAYLVMRQLCAMGVVTGAWAAEQSILPHVFRSIITGFRRHGARIDTDNNANVLTYRLPVDLARMVPITEAQLFSGTPRDAQPAIQAAPAPVAQPAPAPVADVRATLAFDFFEGLSESTRAWVMQRRAVFNEDARDDQMRAA
jgi:hypothetical protein